MKISARTEYACIAMLELAANFSSPEPVRIRQIAKQQGIPSRFLVQILLQLKGAGLVTSTRGAAGGYQLVKPPEEITLGEVMAVIEGPREIGAPGTTVESSAARTLRETWREVDEVEQEMLAKITFADLVERTQRASHDMYYI